jgi:hypothetical protein
MIEDNIIQYDDEAKMIYFAGNITSFVFYNQLFNALREHYNINGVDVAPVFSFSYVERFDPLVVPNLISLGLILKKIHHKPTRLEIARTNATKFLDDGWFFRAVGRPNIFSEDVGINLDGYMIRHTTIQETGYEIYDFEPKMLGFYNNSDVSKHYRADHRVYVFREDSFRYYDRFSQNNTTEKELDSIRTDKLTELEPLITNRFNDVLCEKGRPTLNIRDTRVVLAILTELITNAVLYSGSHCSAMLQRIGNITKISISDCGAGFEYSIKKKQEKFGKEYRNVFDEFSFVEQVKYKNFLYIFETLSYSKEKEESRARENLYTLLKTVLKKRGESDFQEGTIRIHYNNVQVIMTSNRCAGCSKIIPKKCARCLLNDYNPTKEISKSNLRFFDSSFTGVHIEVELKF